MNVPSWETQPSSVGPSQAPGQTPQFLGRKEHGACCPRKHLPPHPHPRMGALLAAATPAACPVTTKGVAGWGVKASRGHTGSWRRSPVWGCLSRVHRALGFRKNPEKMKVPETSGFLATFLFTRNDFQVKSVFQSLPAWRPRVAASWRPGIGGGRLALRGHGTGRPSPCWRPVPCG